LRPARARPCLWLCFALCLASGCRPGRPDGPSGELEASAPVEALRAAWKRFPLVALGEVHGIKEYGAFVERMIDSDALTDLLDDIVVEFGSADHQRTIDRYVTGSAISPAELDGVLRDTTQLMAWDSPIYVNIFSAVRRANQRRPAARRLRVLLGDPPIDWAATTTVTEYRRVADQRDQHFAALVEREVLARGRRGLLLMGSFHALKRSSRETVGSLLQQRHPGAIFIVMLYAGMGPHTAQVEAALETGPRPGIVALSTSWIGSLSARSAFVLPPVLQLPAELELRDIADAYLYLGPESSLTEAWPARATYEEPAYRRELERRYPLVSGRPLDLKQILEGAP
jgi:hypothetical protein